MFGLSFPKILLLAAVIAIVWFGFRWLQRLEKEGRLAWPGAARRPPPGPSPRLSAQDMTACAVCGTFVAIGSVTSCGRSDCPYGR